MSTDKSGRKRLVGKLATGIILVLVMVYATVFSDFLPNIEQNNEEIETSTSELSEEQNLEGELLLTMIDVGQADSFFLKQGEHTLLIDCGTRSTGSDVVEYLKNQGITKIDYVFGTHPHEDHMGGMYDVITNFEIGKIILPKVEAGEVTTNWYMKLMNEIATGNYTLEYVELGAIYQFGDATIKVIGPIEKPSGNLNNYSTVLKVTFGEMDVIMTGDAEKDVEAAILKSNENIEAEILKVGHHGSDTSSSTDFLDAINPQYALISTKVGNKYNHPTKETMLNLQERNITVYRTDECGTVIATITQNSVTFQTKPGDYLSGIELEERGQKWKVLQQ